MKWARKGMYGLLMADLMGCAITKLDENNLQQSIKLKNNDLKRIEKIRKIIPEYKENKIKKYKIYKEYAVSTENKKCSELSGNILERGGNAMDGAVAAAICIGILNSFSSGIGGGGFLLGYYEKENKKTCFSYDFRETAPMKIKTETFRVNPGKAKTGGMAVGVPGEILGLYTAHKKYGKLPWKELFNENIKLAEGFKASKLLETKLKKNEKEIMEDPGMKEIYTKNGLLIKRGEWVERKNYAKTLKRISEDPEQFYKGNIAEQIVNAIQKTGGIMELEDLKKYKVKERKPIQISFRGFTVYSTSLPSAGILVLKALKILEKIDFTKIRIEVEEGKVERLYHILTEIYKFVSAQRGELSDPEFDDQSKILAGFISEKSANSIIKKISEEGPLKISEYGMECPFCEDHGTTHINVVDRDGMVVQITSTVNLEFGAKFMDRETGIIFNNQIDDFYIPGVKNAYGLSKASKNIIKPGKRPFSSAAPTLFVSENEIIAIGAAGGTRIPTAILDTVAYLILGLGVDQSVTGVRIHEQLVPSTIFVEKFFPAITWRRLESAGHKLRVSRENTDFTSVQVMQIFRNGKKRNIIAVADPRKDGGSFGK